MSLEKAALDQSFYARHKLDVDGVLLMSREIARL